MPFLKRSAILKNLRQQMKTAPLLGCGAGTGISAKFIEKGGADLIIIYNSGRYRMAGRGSAAGLLSYGDANAIVVDMASEVLPVVQHTPVLAGVCGTDPFRIMKVFLKQLRELGFDGVQNFPTVGVIDGGFRQSLEETGMSYGLEVDMIRTAHQLDMLTCPYVFNTDEACAMTKAGADLIVAHMGTTNKGSIGASTTISLDEAASRVQAIHDAAKRIRKEVLVICHGGPIAEPADAQYIFDHTTGIAGFFGASSVERLSVESALENATRQFKGLTTQQRKPATPPACTIVSEKSADITRYDWGRICMLLNTPPPSNARFGTVTVHAGAQGHELHQHATEDEIIYVVSGKGTYLSGNAKNRPVQAGDCIFVPAGVPHTTTNRGADDLKVVVVYLPTRAVAG